jgi:hypothetical protein
MERMKRPSFSPKFSQPEASGVSLPSSTVVTRWIPLMCAGAAACVSIVALHEIKNMRKEIVSLKKEQSGSLNEQINKRMETMEGQLKLLADFVQNRENINKESNIMRNVLNEEQPDIHIINGEEYEEVEVTDDEEDEVNEVSQVDQTQINGMNGMN